MAYALKYDGVAEFAPLTALQSQNNSSSINWNLEFTVGNDGSEAVILGTNSSSFTDYLILRSANNLHYRRAGSNYLFSVTDASTPALYRFELRWSGGTRVLSLYENGVFLSSQNISTAAVMPATYLARAFNVFRNTRYDDYLLYEDLEQSSNSIRLDFTNSNHAASPVVITETINGNDVTSLAGTWVNLGGNVATSGDALFEISKVEFTGSALATLPQPVGDISFLLESLEFSGEASATMPQPDGNIYFELSSVEFSGDISASLPNPVIEGYFKLDGVEFSGTASASKPNPQAYGYFELPVIEFSGSAGATLTQAMIDGGFDIEAVEFHGRATVSGVDLPFGEVITPPYTSNIITLPNTSNLIKL